jgi:hypothetical protein
MIAGLLLALLLVASSAWAQAPWSGCQYLTAGANITILCPDALGRGGATISSSGGGAGATPGGVSGNLQTNNGAGGFGAYGGTVCANQFVRTLSASGVATCAAVANTDLSNSTIGVSGTTNQITSSSSSVALGGSTTLSLPATLIAPGSLAVTTRTGTPSTFATFDSGGKLVDGAAYVAPVTAAPVGAQYWTGAADSTLTAEKNLGALSTGLVLNTAGVPTAYAGTSCTNQFPRSVNASGAATCASVANADLVNTATTVNGVTCTLGSPCTIPVGTGTVTSFSAGTLSPLFTTSVATAATTPALSFTQSTAPSNTIFANSTGAPAAPTFTTMDLLLDRSYGTTQGNLLFRGALGWQALTPGTAGQVLQTGGPAAAPSWTTPATVIPPPCGRLTLTSGVPVTTADVTGASTIYYTPYLCNSLTIWDGAKYVRVTFSETSLALSGLISGRPYDIFGYLVGSTLTLQLVAWTNDTTRASAITLSEGMWLKVSDGRLLLGTIYTTSSSTTEDSAGTTASQFGGRRFVSNVYHRVPRRNAVYDTTSFWTYNTAAWRIANGATSPNNCIQWVSALPEQGISATVRAGVSLGSQSSLYSFVGIGFDGANPSLFQLGTSNTTSSFITIPLTAHNDSYLGAGRHVVCWLEAGAGEGTSNFLGQYGANVSGMTSLVDN